VKNLICHVMIKGMFKILEIKRLFIRMGNAEDDAKVELMLNGKLRILNCVHFPRVASTK
jgi:hypothetical protein